MAVAPPAFTEKLSLAFVSGQLKALAPPADQNVDDIITPNLATIFPVATVTAVDRIPIIPLGEIH
ncbi:MAG: hypothetical protein K2X08_05290 [Chlamydiales bacterium]|nr:hypothetical protein [Chlamydiales bacterium]